MEQDQQEEACAVVQADEVAAVAQARKHLDAAIDLLDECGMEIAAAHASLARALLNPPAAR